MRTPVNRLLQRHRKLLTLCSACLLLAAACTKGVSWTQAEIRNAENILRAVESASRAATLANQAPADGQSAAHKQRILEELRKAHVQASIVEDHILDKIHPRMHSQFRGKFQKALGRLIRYYESGSLDQTEQPATDIVNFYDWYRSHYHEFRLWNN